MPVHNSDIANIFSKVAGKLRGITILKGIEVDILERLTQSPRRHPERTGCGCLLYALQVQPHRRKTDRPRYQGNGQQILSYVLQNDFGFRKNNGKPSVTYHYYNLISNRCDLHVFYRKGAHKRRPYKIYSLSRTP